MKKIFIALICVFGVTMACQTQPADSRHDHATDSSEHQPSVESAGAAKSLEGRLLAPCCWNQTLDVHESELATALRTEIATRLEAGEPASKIEDDLANRYSERIRVVPRGKDPREAMPFIVGGGMVLSAIGLTLLLRSWRRRSRKLDTKPALPGPTVPDEYDRRLDDELARMDG